MQVYRCYMPDCGKILFKGEIQSAKIEIICKCGTTNNIAVEAVQRREESRESKPLNGKKHKLKFSH